MDQRKRAGRRVSSRRAQMQASSDTAVADYASGDRDDAEVEADAGSCWSSDAATDNAGDGDDGGGAAGDAASCPSEDQESGEDSEAAASAPATVNTDADGDVLNLRVLIDEKLIEDLEQLMELPSEEVEFPPLRRDSEEEEDSEDEEEEGNNGKGGEGGGKSGGVGLENAKAKRRIKRKRRTASRRQRKEEDEETADDREHATHGHADDEAELDEASLYDCQPDKEIEYYKLPDI